MVSTQSPRDILDSFDKRVSKAIMRSLLDEEELNGLLHELTNARQLYSHEFSLDDKNEIDQLNVKIEEALSRCQEASTDSNKKQSTDQTKPDDGNDDPHKAARPEFEKAEDYFYNDLNWAKALEWYDRALEKDPRFNTAKSQRELAQKYLREGMPVNLLPAAILRPFILIDTCLTRLDYKTAQDYLTQAQTAWNKEFPGKTWIDGDNKQVELENRIAAEKYFEEGKQCFADSNLREALNKVSKAIETSPVPNYQFLAFQDEIEAKKKEVDASINSIKGILKLDQPSTTDLKNAKLDWDLYHQYILDSNLYQTLDTGLQNKISNKIHGLISNTKDLIKQLENSNKIFNHSKELFSNVKKNIEEIESLN